MKSGRVTIQIKAIEQNFRVVLFVFDNFAKGNSRFYLSTLVCERDYFTFVASSRIFMTCIYCPFGVFLFNPKSCAKTTFCLFVNFIDRYRRMPADLEQLP